MAKTQNKRKQIKDEPKTISSVSEKIIKEWDKVVVTKLFFRSCYAITSKLNLQRSSCPHI